MVMLKAGRKGPRSYSDRKLRLIRSATTMSSTRHDSTGKERKQHQPARVTLPRVKSLENAPPE